MFASRLLDILQTVPSDVEYESCVFDLAEEYMAMKESKKDNSPLPLEVKGDDESWEATLADDLNNENRAKDFPTEEDQNGISFHLSPNTPALDSIATDTNPFTDKNVLECDLPELVICYKETDYHVVKDICVDEGLPVKDKILTKNYDDDDDDGKLLAEEKTKLPSDSSIDKDSGKNCVLEGEIKSSDEGSLVDQKLPIQEFGTRSFLRSFMGSLDDDDNKDIRLHNQIPSGNVQSTEAVPNARSLSYNSELESGSITFNFNAPEKVKVQPIDAGDDKDSYADKESVHKQQALITSDEKSDDSSGDSQVQSGNSNNRSEEDVHEQQSVCSSANIDEQAFEGESSFAVGRVAYSEPITFSGSVSIESESSATSARSFAFPVLPNEWNSSPVRMAKAERRDFRRHKGWRSGLLCCRF